VISAPPLLTGVVHDTTDCWFAYDDASTDVGAAGTVEGVAVFESSEALLVPALFVAVTVKV
jgi:hypothetical protein